MFSFRLVKMKAHWRDPRIQLRHPAFTHVLCVQTGSIGSSSTSSDSPADLEVGNWKILERLQTAASQTVPLSASFKVPYKRSPSFSFFLFFPWMLWDTETPEECRFWSSPLLHTQKWVFKKYCIDLHHDRSSLGKSARQSTCRKLHP